MSQTEVWMCYGCCCGVSEVDSRHRPRREPIDRIRAALQSKLAEGGMKDMQIRKTGCLGPCAKGNMVVVHRPGIDAFVFQGINNRTLGEKIAGFAIDVERKGWGTAVPESLEHQVYGTVSADEVPAPPSPEPYADRRRG